MRKAFLRTRIGVLLLFIILVSLTSCLTSKKLDKYVAKHYNNELPKLNKRNKPELVVTTAAPANQPTISTTTHKTNKFLPLLVYWEYKHQHSCSLNNTIAVTNFTNAVNAAATKGLTQKLNGQKLELVVEQAPSAFSIVSNEHMVWVVYAFSWAKIYIEPDAKDLVVSYKLVQADQTLKTGRITVPNTSKNKGIRFFQTWKSATNEYLMDYTSNLTAMTKTFVNQLTQEL
jgi:hypothetical protein